MYLIGNKEKTKGDMCAILLRRQVCISSFLFYNRMKSMFHQHVYKSEDEYDQTGIPFHDRKKAPDS